MGRSEGKLSQAVAPSVAACGGMDARCRLYTPCAARTPTRAAVAFRTAHLHCGPIARTKFGCAFDARVIARGKFSTFSGPQNLGGGVGPAPGSAVLQLGLVWQAKQAVAAKKAAEEAEQVRSSPALYAFGLRRTVSDTRSCAEWRHPSHSHSALCRARAMRLRLRVRTSGRWARLRVRAHGCSR